MIATLAVWTGIPPAELEQLDERMLATMAEELAERVKRTGA